jgi:hypothetical protein
MPRLRIEPLQYLCRRTTLPSQCLSRHVFVASATTTDCPSPGVDRGGERKRPPGGYFRRPAAYWPHLPTKACAKIRTLGRGPWPARSVALFLAVEEGLDCKPLLRGGMFHADGIFFLDATTGLRER